MENQDYSIKEAYTSTSLRKSDGKFLNKMLVRRTFFKMVQWLRLHASIAGVAGSIPG